MIEYSETFEFENELGKFKVNAYTQEHPSNYGNGMLLRFDIESDYPVERHRLFDIRYEQDDVAKIARQLIKQEFGIEVSNE